MSRKGFGFALAATASLILAAATAWAGQDAYGYAAPEESQGAYGPAISGTATRTVSAQAIYWSQRETVAPVAASTPEVVPLPGAPPIAGTMVGGPAGPAYQGPGPGYGPMMGPAGVPGPCPGPCARPCPAGPSCCCTAPCGGCCGSCDGPAFGATFCTCPGWIGDAELTMLRPRVGNFITGGENDFSPAPRVSLGYVNCNGLGFRTTFWQFDQNLAAETTGVGVGSLNAYAIDNEITQRISFCLWDMTLGAGIRYGAVEHRYNFTLDQAESYSNSFFGIGPTVSLDVRRPLGCTCFSLVGKVRGSLLLGQQYASALDDPDTVDSAVAVGEIQLGGEWSKPLRCGGRLFVQGLWEAQVWRGSEVGSGDLGMIGGTLAIGLSR